MKGFQSGRFRLGRNRCRCIDVYVEVPFFPGVCYKIRKRLRRVSQITNLFRGGIFISTRSRQQQAAIAAAAAGGRGDEVH